MIQYFRRLFFGDDPPLEEEKDNKEENKPSFFSHSSFGRFTTSEEKTKIDLKKPSLKSIGDAKGFTFDSAMDAYGMDASTLKSAFSSTTSIPNDLYNWYATQGFIGYQACAVLSQHWLINKAISLPAKDALKNGYDIYRSDGEELEPEILDRIKELDKELSLDNSLFEMETNKRRFGFRLCLFCVESNDPDYYKKPFNLDGVTLGSYKGISQIDPSWVAPILDQQSVASPASKDFYEPTWWQINGKMYHRTHFTIVRYVELPDILKPSYQYGGISLTQLIMERVYSAERTANEAPMLAETKRTNVLYADIASISANPQSFEDRLNSFINYRNNYGVYVAGSEDKIDQMETSLSDLDDLIMTQYQLVAAISGVPATKLLGTSPKGFSSTGEHEMISYYDLLETIQNDMEKLIDKHHKILIKSYISPNDPFDIKVSWRPLQTPSAIERASINLSKSQSDAQLQQTGAIDAYDIRNRLIDDPYSGYSGIEQIEDDYENETEASTFE
jgi:phage-related protein (TIGR01555 family)